MRGDRWDASHLPSPPLRSHRHFGRNSHGFPAHFGEVGKVGKVGNFEALVKIAKGRGDVADNRAREFL